MNLYDVIGDYASFYKTLTEKVNKLGIDTSRLSIDHFCYRTSSVKTYQQKKKELFKLSKRFIENIHHNRPISKFILKKPLVVNGQKVWIIELPAPKKNVNYKDGLEHFEFVLGKKFEPFKKKYENLWDGQDDSGKFNQPVFIKFNEGAVKFHERPIDEVVKLEGKVFKKV